MIRNQIPCNPDHPHIRWELISVRDVDEPDIGIRDTNLSDVSELKRRGVGSLLAHAHREVEDRLDLDEYVGEAVAEVYCDVEEWDYAIVWRVEIPLRQRIRQCLFPRTGPTVIDDSEVDRDV